MITVNHIVIKRGVQNIIKKISWEINKEEKWILYGLNGSGKTTLLSALAGYGSVYDGEIVVEGKGLNGDTKKEWRQKSGFVSSSFFTNCYRTESNLDIVLSGLYGRIGVGPYISTGDIRKAKEMLNRVGLKGKSQYPFDTLSSGQRQKVLLARALIQNPDVLFLDEPFNALDIIGTLEVKEILNEWQKNEGKTMVCVTHHSEEITTNYTHALLLKQGKIHSQGKIREIFTTDNFSDFLGREIGVTWEKEHVDFQI